MGNLDQMVSIYLILYCLIDIGRHYGLLLFEDIVTVVVEFVFFWLSFEPIFSIDNNVVIGYMWADDVLNYFIVGLNGSGHVVIVVDLGIDWDHGDFDGRIQYVELVIWGDFLIEDEHLGHGTYVVCMVLGNGSCGGYVGVVL